MTSQERVPMPGASDTMPILIGGRRAGKRRAMATWAVCWWLCWRPVYRPTVCAFDRNEVKT